MFCKDHDFASFRQQTHNVTQEFAQLSQHVAATIEQLKLLDADDAHDIVVEIQRLEAAKLKAVCKSARAC